VLEINGKRGHREAPLYRAVQDYLKKRNLSFHVPLHGGGSGTASDLRKIFSSYLRWDLTELDTLDDLHLPLTAIFKAQGLAARLFGSAETFFLVNGVTVGILALLLTFCRPNEKVLLSRISHKAALHGILLSGARPVYLPVERERTTGFPLNISLDTVKKALQEHPDAKLLLITSPSYWGVTADLQGIREVAAKYGVVLAVDEAHGAHLPFYPAFLSHSAAAKADIWLHSAHKALGALTPGAFLHANVTNGASSLKFWLQALQTSSPSYPVMISLDLVRRRMALRGTDIFSRSWEWAMSLRHNLARAGMRLLSPEMVKKEGFDLDPCRLTLLFPGGEGQYMARKMAQRHHLQVEMKDHSYILMIAGPSHFSLAPTLVARAIARSRAGFSHAGHKRYLYGTGSLSDFSPSFFNASKSAPGLEREYLFPPISLSPTTAFRSKLFAVPLEKSPGEICGEMITPTPPGIPVLSPGEVMTGETCAYLLRKKAEGAFFQGAADHTLQTIQIVADKERW
jgi:arginine decarboxylase